MLDEAQHGGPGFVEQRELELVVAVTKYEQYQIFQISKFWILRETAVICDPVYMGTCFMLDYVAVFDEITALDKNMLGHCFFVYMQFVVETCRLLGLRPFADGGDLARCLPV